MIETAYAKINLALHVRRRREDGYHELETLFAFVDAGDALSAAPAPRDELLVSGEFASTLEDPFGNIVAKALNWLPHGPGWRVRLDKRLPVAAGLGGGSADAAAALRVLSGLWGINLPLDDIALKLGADVPACLHGRSCLVSGIGEHLQPAPALGAPLHIVLVNPGLPLETRAVFAARAGDFSEPAPLDRPCANAFDLALALKPRRNDLEPAARFLVPEIDDVLAALADRTGCLLARLSGSGPTCFGLFADARSAELAVRRLSMGETSWWVAAATIPG
jgi:4-diphosphocytidyl-2-C-methyl-D-erythritol kinase